MIYSDDSRSLTSVPQFCLEGIGDYCFGSMAIPIEDYDSDRGYCIGVVLCDA